MQDLLANEQFSRMVDLARKAVASLPQYDDIDAILYLTYMNFIYNIYAFHIFIPSLWIFEQNSRSYFAKLTQLINFTQAMLRTLRDTRYRHTTRTLSYARHSPLLRNGICTMTSVAKATIARVLPQDKASGCQYALLLRQN